MSAKDEFMGYKISTRTLDSLVLRSLESMGEAPTKQVFSCANPHSLALAENTPEFKLALKTATILVTDGVGLSLVGSVFGANVGPRITGGDYFAALMTALDSLQIEGRRPRVFFFGSSQSVLDLVKNNTMHIYPNIDVCGLISPPYGDWSDEMNDDFINAINKAKPDLLWVGMTAPKQEIWSYKNRAALGVPVIGNVGAVFDFFAGTFTRAPGWATRFGIEWLFRLCKEPRRMWRRNLVSPVLFISSAYISSRLKSDGRSQV